jgi:hypothetical protein
MANSSQPFLPTEAAASQSTSRSRAKRANEGIWEPPVISAARKPTNRRKEKSRLLSMDSSLAEHPRRGSLRRRRESSSALREYSPVRGLSIYLLLLTGGRRHRVGGLAHSCAEWAEENSQSHNLRYTLLYWFQFMMLIFVIYTFCRINLAMVDL